MVSSGVLCVRYDFCLTIGTPTLNHANNEVGSLAMGAQQTISFMLTSAHRPPSLGTPSIQHVHDYDPFALGNGGPLAHVAVDLIDRLAIMVAVRRFPSMGAADSLSLWFESYARMTEFIRACGTCTALYLQMCPSVDFLGMCVMGPWNALMWFFIARWVTISVMPCKMIVVHLLLLASLLRGLRLRSVHVFFAYSLLVDSTNFFVINILSYYINEPTIVMNGSCFARYK
jgi:hypothetical protein